MSKLFNVGILFGGKSVEHHISILSATNVVAALDRERFHPLLIGIDKDGKWYLCDEVSEGISSGTPLSICLDATAPYFKPEDGKAAFLLDIVFPVLHGTDGEDGSIQGLLQTMGLPYVGSDVAGSAMAMDKTITKKLLQASGIPVCPFLTFHIRNREIIDFEKVKKSLGVPFIAKPASLGSSVGVRKVDTEEQLDMSVEEVFAIDTQIIFESFVPGRELECAVLGNKSPRASAPGEIVLQGKYEYYTFEAKYEDKEATTLVIPADLDADTIEKIKHCSVLAYQSLGCKDFARIDLFLTHKGEVIVNEVNSIPGFTNVSMFPQLWEVEGISYTLLISQLIDLGLEKAALRDNKKTSLDTALD